MTKERPPGLVKLVNESTKGLREALWATTASFPALQEVHTVSLHITALILRFLLQRIQPGNSQEGLSVTVTPSLLGTESTGQVSSLFFSCVSPRILRTAGKPAPAPLHFPPVSWHPPSQANTARQSWERSRSSSLRHAAAPSPGAQPRRSRRSLISRTHLYPPQAASHKAARVPSFSSTGAITSPNAQQGLGCAARLYFLVLLGRIECLLLVAMAYDRYIAICDPLRPLIMRRGLCIRPVVGSWVAVVPVQVGQTYQVFTLPFCASHDLHHVFCDVPPLLETACADTLCNQVTLYTIILVFATFPVSLIVISYIKIIRAILKISSVLGRHKAFSTCSSHLAVVTLLYGSATVVYERQSRDSVDTDKYLALFYTIVTPMFNPVIYSLRNMEVRIALKRLLLQSMYPAGPHPGLELNVISFGIKGLTEHLQHKKNRQTM
ncbi:LOW QUALITY PROTEIN: olfactory receptor 5G29-like [Alca torda]